MSDLQEKLQSLVGKLGRNNPRAAEAEVVEVQQVTWAEGQSGAEVDWSDYEIEPENLQLYIKSRFHNGEWYCPYVHYTTINSTIGKLSEELEERVNGSDWKIISIQPNGSGMQAVLLTRTTVHKMPYPTKITKVPPPVYEVGDESQIAKWENEQKGTQ